MADINATAQVNKNSDAKIRNAMDFSAGADLSGGQFMDMISSTVSSFNMEDDSAIKGGYNVSAKNEVKYSYNTSEKADAKQVSEVRQPVEKADVKEKIRAKLKEIAAKNDVEIKDTKALKALQKVANFLLKASEEGQIALPKAMIEKLQDFVAKGDDLKAADITQFMSDFSDMFKQIIIPMSAAAAQIPVPDENGNVVSEDEGIKWPKEILEALKDLDVQGTIFDPEKPLTILDVLRTVKALVNESEKVAIKTLDEKSRDTLASQDQAAMLVANNVAAAAVVPAQPVVKAEDKPVAVEAEVQADTLAAIPDVSADEAAKKAIKDLEKSMQQAAQVAPALPVKEDKAAKESLAAAQLPELPTAKETPKSGVFASAANFTDADATIIRTPVTITEKTSPVSLSRISLEAQAPGQDAEMNGDKSGEGNAHDNSRNAAADIVQAKANTGANLAASAAHDVKFAAAEVSADTISSPAISAAGLNTVTDGVKAAGRATQAAATTASLPSAATQQVIAHIQKNADKSAQISVQLTPAELGRVEVRLNIQKDGQVHTVVVVDKPETLALLQKDSAHLERSLQQAGLNADAKNMSFNLRDGQAQQSGQERKRFSRASIGTEAVTEVAVNIAAEGQVFTDTRVNYHA